MDACMQTEPPEPDLYHGYAILPGNFTLET